MDIITVMNLESNQNLIEQEICINAQPYTQFNSEIQNIYSTP